jgi:GntR family transcriptional regulator
MLVELDPESPVAIFQQIAEEVERCIAVGILKPEEPLPAVRRLASDLGINANTVQHAYRTLEQAGVVHVRRGQGTYVSARRVEPRRSQAQKAREIAQRMLREGYRHGLLASDLIAALQAIAPPGGGARRSGARGEQQVGGD